MVLISSKNNPKIRLARALRQRKARQESGLFIVEGIRPVGEAIQAGVSIDSIIYAPDLLTSEFALDLVREQAHAGVQCYPTTPEVFAALAEKENPQGLLALVHRGGLAGMEAARVAALRGHDVILCEKERTWGAC